MRKSCNQRVRKINENNNNRAFYAIFKYIFVKICFLIHFCIIIFFNKCLLTHLYAVKSRIFFANKFVYISKGKSTV